MKLSRLRLPMLPLLGAAAVAVVLLVTAGILGRSVSGASELVVRGLGEGWASAARAAVMEAGPGNEEAALQELLDERGEEGLLALRLVDEAGRSRLTVGTPQRADAVPRPGTVSWSGARARYAVPVPGRLMMRVRPEGRGPAEGRPRRQRWLLVIDFEPRPALELKAQARRVVWVAVGSAVGILALAFALQRALLARERVEAELERGRRLAALGEMSAVLAHELRNPLASLKGHAQLLAETVEDDAALAPKVNRLVGDAVRMEQRMNDLLSFARSGELRRVDTVPDEVLRRAIDAAVDSTGADPMRVQTSYGAPVPWPLDPERMHEALENVVRNALQASDPDGAVKAEVHERRGALVFTVTDSGPGLPPELADRLFEPFVTSKVRGVGLGLAVTRRAVELHGGRVTARNGSGGGATFELCIPKR